MTSRSGAVALLAGTALLAGCASAASHPSSAPPAAAAAPLATSMSVTGAGTWAIVAMGGSSADQNNFWELFTRPAGSTQWELVTPPGVADNGGLVASGGDGSLTVAFRPSQGLTFSPLASTRDDGKTWATGLVDAAVAAVPDALAAGSGSTLALLADGTIEQSSAASANWTKLATAGAIATSPAGRQCQVTGLTAVAYTRSGSPLAAASCGRSGIVGIFARTAAGTWQAAGPAAPGGDPVRVLRLTGTAAGDTALLESGTGSAASLFAAWTADGTRWTTSSALSTGSAQVLASGTGPGSTAWVLLTDGRAAIIPGPGAAWRQLPAPPKGTATLAAVSGTTVDALAVNGANLTVYQLTQGGTWTKTQSARVPIQYGSSS